MINTSLEYRQSLEKSRDFIGKASCILKDGTRLEFDKKNLMSNGLSVSDAVSSSGKFDIGAVIINQATLLIDNTDEKYSDYNFEDAVITVFAGLQIGIRTEWLKKGVFHASDPTTTPSIITLKAVDNMSKFDKDYDGKLNFPAKLKEIVQECCQKCGVQLLTEEFPNAEYEIQKNSLKEIANITYRLILSYCAVIAGCFARCNADGLLELRWYDKAAFSGIYDADQIEFAEEKTVIEGGEFGDIVTDIVDPGEFTTDYKYHHIYNFSSLSMSTEDVVITGIRVTASDDESEDGKKLEGETYLCGTEGYVLEISKNPFVEYGQAKKVAQYLGNKMIGMRFRPMNASTLGNPAWEAGDAALLTDRKGNSYQCYLTSVNYSVGNYAAISCDAEPTKRHSANRYSEIEQIAADIKKDTEFRMSEYAKYINMLNELAINAMGYYETTEKQDDGSEIKYMHDKPKLEDSQIIYKKSIDGYFWSKDGGKTWSYGIDKNGNAVMNTIATIGLFAEWIIAGSLKSTNWVKDKAGFQLNLDEGTINSKNLKLDITGLLTLYKALISGGEIIINDSSGKRIFHVDETTGFIFGSGDNGAIRYDIKDEILKLYKDTRLYGTISNYTSDGKKSLDIGNNNINFYSWSDDGNWVGSIFAGEIATTGRKLLSLCCDQDDQVAIGYFNGTEIDGHRSFDRFMRFDPQNVGNDPSDYTKERPIMFASTPRISGNPNGTIWIGPTKVVLRSGIIISVESGTVVTGTFKTGAGETVNVVKGAITSIE